MCNLCGQDCESVGHFLWNCPVIDIIYGFCSKWRLHANVNKSAVLVFGKDKVYGTWTVYVHSYLPHHTLESHNRDTNGFNTARVRFKYCRFS